MGGDRALVALIHATPLAIPPTRAAFEAEWPQATLWNLLDDRLMEDADAAGGLTDALHRRMATLIRHAVDGGARGVLLSCSMYGPVLTAEDLQRGVPMLGSDEAMYEEAARRTPRRVAVLGTTNSTATDSARRLRLALAAAGQPEVDVVPVVVEGGLAAA
jgi:aspartate/glutamate racemase